MALALLALAAIASAPANLSTQTGPSTQARASAPATVRILPGARIHLGPSSMTRMVKAAIRVEGGQRRPAFLIEFE